MENALVMQNIVNIGAVLRIFIRHGRRMVSFIYCQQIDACDRNDLATRAK